MRRLHEARFCLYLTSIGWEFISVRICVSPDDKNGREIRVSGTANGAVKEIDREQSVSVREFFRFTNVAISRGILRVKGKKIRSRAVAVTELFTGRTERDRSTRRGASGTCVIRWRFVFSNLTFLWNRVITRQLEWQNRNEGTILTSRRVGRPRRARFATGKLCRVRCCKSALGWEREKKRRKKISRDQWSKASWDRKREK